MKRKKIKKKIVLSPHRRGNVTSVVTLRRKPPLDKQNALKSKIRDILNGNSRFVIRKPTAAGTKSSKSDDRATSKLQEQEKVPNPPSVTWKNEEVKKDRCVLLYV